MTDAPDALDKMQRGAVRMTVPVKPGFVVDVTHVDDQGVSFPRVIQRGDKLRSVCNRGDLLAEELPAACSLEVPELGIEASLLFKRGERVAISVAMIGRLVSGTEGSNL